jgi:transcriptional regulator with XRE-family HTH domain
MEMLKTIEEVLKYNLRSLRGNRSQQEVSDAVGIPFRTYQGLESGVIPKKRHYLTALAQHYGVSETRFFLDPDLTRPTVEQAFEVLREAIKKP